MIKRLRTNRILVNPFEFFFSIICFVFGMVVFFTEGRASPNSMQYFFNDFSVYLWSVTLIVGGVMTFTSMMLGILRTEFAGVTTLGVSTLMYGGVLFVVALPTGGGFAAATYTAFGICFLTRAYLLYTFIKERVEPPSRPTRE